MADNAQANVPVHRGDNEQVNEQAGGQPDGQHHPLPDGAANAAPRGPPYGIPNYEHNAQGYYQANNCTNHPAPGQVLAQNQGGIPHYNHHTLDRLMDNPLSRDMVRLMRAHASVLGAYGVITLHGITRVTTRGVATLEYHDDATVHLISDQAQVTHVDIRYTRPIQLPPFPLGQQPAAAPGNPQLVVLLSLIVQVQVLVIGHASMNLSGVAFLELYGIGEYLYWLKVDFQRGSQAQ